MTGSDGAFGVWHEVAQKITATGKVDVAAEIEQVLGFLKNQAQDLYTGSPQPHRTVQEMVLLTRDLSRGASEPAVQVRLNFLSKGLELGNEIHGWKVPLVPHLVKIKKPQNWAALDKFAGRTVARQLELAFGRDLE